MTKTNSLIFLIHSMSKSEKRVFRSGRKGADYITLFDLICQEKITSVQELKAHYTTRLNKESFNVAVTYLYNEILEVLLVLRKEQDGDYMLFNKIMKARILFEKSLYDDALELLDKIKSEAGRYENQIALLYASRLELNYLLYLNMPNISESELVKKHFQINEALKMNRIIYEQSALHELLMHRIIHQGNISSAEEKKRMNDLVFAEMSLCISARNGFEAKKLHQMFQSNYLMHMGDQKSALHSFRELNDLFENNPQFWATPPFYYVSVLEGILDNLRSMRYYDQMPYFIRQLKEIKSNLVRFQLYVEALVFLYELFPWLDAGDFAAAKAHLDLHTDLITLPQEQMDLFWRVEISLYTALTYIGLGEYKKARKAIAKEIQFNNIIYTAPSHRVIRLVNLIIYYELNDMEYVRMKIRSLKRELAREGKTYRIEMLMLDFLNSDKWRLATGQRRNKLWAELEPELTDIRNNVYEKQLLKCFDFTLWIESKINRKPLPEVMRERFALNDENTGR